MIGEIRTAARIENISILLIDTSLIEDDYRRTDDVHKHAAGPNHASNKGAEMAAVMLSNNAITLTGVAFFCACWLNQRS